MEIKMRAFLKSLLLFVSIFAAAYVASILIVPDVVPIAAGEQSTWQLDVALVLSSMQNIGLFRSGRGHAAGAIEPVQDFGRTTISHDGRR
jgi:hypothetical protein